MLSEGATAFADATVAWLMAVIAGGCAADVTGGCGIVLPAPLVATVGGAIAGVVGSGVGGACVLAAETVAAAASGALGDAPVAVLGCDWSKPGVLLPCPPAAMAGAGTTASVWLPFEA